MTVRKRRMWVVVASVVAVLLGAVVPPVSLAAGTEGVGETTADGSSTATRDLPVFPSEVIRTTLVGEGEPARSIVGAVAAHGSDPVAPQGVNDWSCRPDARHPRPVILIHGMLMTAYTAWSGLAPVLKKDGYCLFAATMPAAPDTTLGKITSVVGLNFGGLGDIDTSTVLFAGLIREVLRSTGASQVDLVGYSEGGTVANLLAHTYHSRYFHSIITLGGINTGIRYKDSDSEVLLSRLLSSFPESEDSSTEPVEAGPQMMDGSDIMRRARAGGDTVAGITYTNISSRYDQFVMRSQWNPNFQRAVPGAFVTNVYLQEGCPVDFSTHLTIPYNKRAWAMVRNALARRTVVPVPCLLALPAYGTVGG